MARPARIGGEEVSIADRLAHAEKVRERVGSGHAGFAVPNVQRT